jgi:hypothetical protein
LESVAGFNRNQAADIIRNARPTSAESAYAIHSGNITHYVNKAQAKQYKKGGFFEDARGNVVAIRSIHA